MDPLFPALPEDLKSLSDEEVASLLSEHESAIELVKSDDEDFLKGLSADEVIEQLKAGVAQIQTLRTETQERADAHANYVAEKDKITALLEPEESGDPPSEPDPAPDDGDGDDGAVVVAEAEEITAEAVEEAPAETPELVTASTATNMAPAVRFSRTPPATQPERKPIAEPETSGTALVASGGFKVDYPDPLDPSSLAHVMHKAIVENGPAEKTGAKQFTEGPHGTVVWDGPRVKVARAEYPFDADHQLTGSDDDVDKIRAVLPEYVSFFGQQGGLGGEALVASGGLCAPLTPIYSMPNFASEAEPVWDSLPVFQAARGGVNVPTATYIADITTAISSISEANDALGGTFATKSCQDMDCPPYTETAVQILAHCREYGNLNARAWPEKIAHENALTMAALSRVSETFIIDRIKSFFPNVTNGATTLGSLIYVVEAIVRARFGIIGRFRMNPSTRFRAILPYWVPDVLQLDNISTQFDRFRSKDELVAYLRSVGIDPVFYLDSPSTGTTQLPDASQTAAAIDSTPSVIQWGIYPEGALLGIDMGTLELGIVRDSTLNATNDFQVFGERFRNVALIAPAQAGMWVTTTYCSGGQFPPAGTARTCP